MSLQSNSHSSGDQLRDKFEQYKESLTPIQTNIDETIPLDNPDQLHEDEDIHHLLETKLKITSKLEALLVSDFIPLPDDDEIKIKLAAENLELASLESQRTLSYYKDELSRLNGEEKKLNSRIKCVEQVIDKQNMILKEKKNNIVINSIRNSFDESAKLTKFLKVEFNRFVEDRFPEERMLDTIRKLYAPIRKSEDTGGRYLKIDEFNYFEKTCLETLIDNNVVVVNPNDPTLIKFNEPEGSL